MDPLNGIFRGLLTDLYILSRALKAKEMLRFTKDCINPMTNFLKLHNNNSRQHILFDWNQMKVTKEGENTEKIQLRANEVCRDHKEETVKIITIKQNYSNARHMCNQLGGDLYHLRSKKDIEHLSSKFLRNNQFGENETALVDFCGSTFWMPIVQNGTLHSDTGNPVWYLDAENGEQQMVTFLPWLFGQPNGGNALI